MGVGSSPQGTFRGWKNSVGENNFVFRSWVPAFLIRLLATNKMPDVDSYDSSSGIAVDEQQRLNCALP